MKYLIIGGSAAGFNAAKEIRNLDKTAEIIMFSKEEHLPYFRPLVSKSMVKKVPDKRFYLAPKEWYEENNIQLKLSTSVEKICPENNKIILITGEELHYDKLIIASGAKNFMPPTKGITKKGIFTLRDITDAENLKSYIKDLNKAVVIGGGLLGLEAAFELKQLNKDISIVEFDTKVLCKQIDNEASLVIEPKLKNSGLNIYLNTVCEEIIGEDRVTAIKLKNGEIIETDAVIFSIGIRTNKKIADDCSIKTDRGIIVNSKMETSHPNIYACGDVAEFSGIVYGNWPASIEMGKIAGINAAGGTSEFTGFVGSTIFNAANIRVFSCGIINEKFESFSFGQLEDFNYGKLFFEKNSIIGGYLLGNIANSTKILKAVREKFSKNKVIEFLNL
ncbi:NAD(P)/FAD-dependent oxidoreductase [Clostridium sp. DL1XJH146]